MVSLLATLLPQALFIWISKPCRDPPFVLVLTLEVEELVVAVMTNCNCHYCNQPGHFILSCLKFKQDIESKAAGRFPL